MRGPLRLHVGSIPDVSVGILLVDEKRSEEVSLRPSSLTRTVHTGKTKRRETGVDGVLIHNHLRSETQGIPPSKDGRVTGVPMDHDAY